MRFLLSGMIMSAMGFCTKIPIPTRRSIKEALGGNLCICSNYEHIIAAVKSAARKMAKEARHG